MKASLKLLVLFILALPAAVQAQFTFTTNNGAITITGYTGPGGHVVIPDSTNGYPVTTIGGNAFYNKTSLTSVIIPDSVTYLDYYSFYGCSGLINLTIGNGVTNIASHSFRNCSGLTNVTIPENVASIGYGGFYGCSSLKNMTIPNTTTSIGDYAFYSCSGLTNATLGNGVTSIGGGVFQNCSSLINVMIPGTITRIGDSAFVASGLTSVTIPDSVTSVGSSAFQFCPNLTSVMMGGSVTNISYASYALFYGCSHLTNFAVSAANPIYAGAGGVLFDKTFTTLIQFPYGLTGRYVIPNKVTAIGGFSFNYCSGLTNVMIPGSVTDLGSDAFNSSGLTSVVIPDSVTSIGFQTFGYCPSLASVTIPDSVTNIGSYAFIDSGLTNLTIPSSVTGIGDYAFQDCFGLTKAFFKGNAPLVNGVAGNLDATVFQSAGAGTVYYLPGTTGWSNTFGGWPTRLWNPRPQMADGSFGIRSNRFGFNLTGNTNIPVVVEACTHLGGAWIPLWNCTLTNGANYFNDPAWTNYPTRYYRIRSP